MVRAEGLEPPHLAALEPKSSASTNSATPAKNVGGRIAVILHKHQSLYHYAKIA
jgi:hypothetical protein